MITSAKVSAHFATSRKTVAKRALSIFGFLSTTLPRSLQRLKFEANFGGLLKEVFAPKSNFLYAFHWVRQVPKRHCGFGKVLTDLSFDACLGLPDLFEKAYYLYGHENQCHCTAGLYIPD